MKLNADIGESFGPWIMGQDEQIMALIDQANIACGYHAGDALVMQNTIALAKKHGVTIGAHVAYPDLQGFGRRSMSLQANELRAIIHAQIAVLDGLAQCQSAKVSYVKPHGALYNDMMKDINIFKDILTAISSFPKSLNLVIQATDKPEAYLNLANEFDVNLSFEAFADRAYQDNTLLVPRSQKHAVLSEQAALAQAKLLIEKQQVKTPGGAIIKLKVDTLCMHSDTPSALRVCQQVSRFLKN